MSYSLDVSRKEADVVKACCADFYQQAAVKFFLGDSFHPGGLKLTEILAQHLGISKASQVLDIACGEGTSAFFIAGRFGASVTGTDASDKAVLSASGKASQSQKSVQDKVTFIKADTEHLPFAEQSFDRVITECAFSTFSDKSQCAREICRVLKPDGTWGLSDMLVDHDHLPQRMKNLLFQAGCIGQAEGFQGYARRMKDAGLQVIEQQDISWALEEMILEVERRLNTARLLLSELNTPPLASGYMSEQVTSAEGAPIAYSGKLAVTREELDTVEGLISEGRELLSRGIIGYGIIIGKKSG